MKLRENFVHKKNKNNNFINNSSHTHHPGAILESIMNEWQNEWVMNDRIFISGWTIPLILGPVAPGPLWSRACIFFKACLFI